MNLLEYQAHALYTHYDLPALSGIVIESPDRIESSLQTIKDFPVVLKAQVPTGGRGKAGGVVVASSLREAKIEAKRIFNLCIGGHQVERIFVVPRVEITHELYVSFVLERSSRKILILFSGQGGVDINDLVKQDASSMIRIELDPFEEIRSHHVRYILSRIGTKVSSDQLFSLMKNLLRLMKENHCLLVEVNPLALDSQGNLVLIDGKITVDDNALGKLPKLLELRDKAETDTQIVRARASRLLFIPIDKDSGNIGIISNGSGMIMSSIDLITQAGGSVRSALDLGGGATADRVSEAIGIILMDRNVSILFINIFGGITRCDEIVNGVVEAYRISESSVPLVLRLEGTNKDQGLKLLSEQRVVESRVADNLNGGVHLIIQLVNGMKKEKSHECIG